MPLNEVSLKLSPEEWTLLLSTLNAATLRCKAVEQIYPNKPDKEHYRQKAQNISELHDKMIDAHTGSRSI